MRLDQLHGYLLGARAADWCLQRLVSHPTGGCAVLLRDADYQLSWEPVAARSPRRAGRGDRPRVPRREVLGTSGAPGSLTPVLAAIRWCGDPVLAVPLVRCEPGTAYLPCPRPTEPHPDERGAASCTARTCSHVASAVAFLVHVLAGASGDYTALLARSGVTVSH